MDFFCAVTKGLMVWLALVLKATVHTKHFLEPPAYCCEHAYDSQSCGRLALVLFGLYVVIYNL